MATPQEIQLLKRKTASRNNSETGSYTTAHTVTIESGASLSDAANIGEETVVAVLMPSAWTAADISFEVSFDGTTYYDLQDSSAEVSLSVDVDEAIAIDPTNTFAFPYVKVRSGTEASPVNQGADREVILLSKGV